MAEDNNRYSDPKPRNGIGKSGFAALTICILCTVVMTVSGLTMLFNKEPVNPGTTPPGQTDTNPGIETPGTETPGTETPGTETPGTDNPGGSDVVQDVIRELTAEEKYEVVVSKMFGQGYTSIEVLNQLVNDECFIEVDGQEIEAIKVIIDAKTEGQRGTDYMTISAVTPLTEENQNMNAYELIEYLFDSGIGNMQYNETQKQFEGTFDFAEQTAVGLEGSRAVREDVRNGKVVDADGYNKIECLRENLCVAAGYNTQDYKVIITDMIEREINAKGDVEFVIRYDVYDETGCVMAHHESIIESDAKFRETVKADEIYSGTRYDMSTIISKTVELDRNGNPLTQNSEQQQDLEQGRSQ